MMRKNLEEQVEYTVEQNKFLFFVRLFHQIRKLFTRAGMFLSKELFLRFKFSSKPVIPSYPSQQSTVVQNEIKTMGTWFEI